MTAKEMFEKLGYQKNKRNGMFYLIYKKKIDGEFCYVVFDIYDKTFYVEYDYEAMNISMQELKAINKQCQELGWLDE